MTNCNDARPADHRRRGHCADAADRRRLADPLVGGMIHFARNWQRPRAAGGAQRRDQGAAPRHADLRRPRGRPRAALSHRWLHPPAADARAGRTVDARRDARPPQAASGLRAMCWRAELRACGVDFSFTPVLDLDYGESSVIGDRAFHRDARVAALLAKSLMHGLLQAGMANCGKHFPGPWLRQGRLARGDPGRPAQPQGHPGRRCARPTTGSAPRSRAVMPAHVIYPKVDARPAGFSQPWLQRHPARPAGLRRRGVQRRPEHGRRAP